MWRLLTDADGFSSWNDAVISLDGPIAVGRSIDLVSTADPERTFTLEVAEMTEPTRMVWTDGMPLGLFTGTRTYELTAAGEGTDFSMVEEFTGPLVPLIWRTMPDLQPSFDRFVDGLAARVTGR